MKKVSFLIPIVLATSSCHSQVSYTTDPYVARSIPKERALEVVRATLRSNLTRGKSSEILDSSYIKNIQVSEEGYSYHLEARGIFAPSTDVSVKFSEIERIGIYTPEHQAASSPLYLLKVEARGGNVSWLRFRINFDEPESSRATDATLRDTAERMYDALWALRLKE